MTKLEKVEKIIEKTGVTYGEAKEALEASNEDILDAVVFLEKSGRVKGPAQQTYTTKAEDISEEFLQAAKAYESASEDEKFSNVLTRFLKWCGVMIRKGCENFFLVKRHEEEVINVPVVVLILLLFFAFWAVVPLLIIGLFFGYSYSFRGNITKTVDINKACGKASEAAEAVKKEFMEDMRKSQKTETEEV